MSSGDITLTTIAIATLLLLLGLAVGSYLAVVTYRFPRGKSTVFPPSACPHCTARIRPFDNIPVISWLILRGKCRDCGKAISPRYPVIELATGFLWVAAGWKVVSVASGPSAMIAAGVVWLAFVSSVVVTFVMDCEHMRIPDGVSVGGMVAAVLVSPFLPSLYHAETAGEFANHYHNIAALFTYTGIHAGPWLRSLAASLLGATLGIKLGLFLRFVGNKMFLNRIQPSGEEFPEPTEESAPAPAPTSSLGSGDIKLMGFYGALFGWRGIVCILLGAAILGALVGVCVKLLYGDSKGKRGWSGLQSRWLHSSSVIPFGPFLASAALVWFFAGDVLL